MQTIQVRESTGKDGILHLQIPVGRAETECEIVVVVQPKETAISPSSENQGWPADYFEKTFGSITDDTFERPPQGELPPPVELD